MAILTPTPQQHAFLSELCRRVTTTVLQGIFDPEMLATVDDSQMRFRILVATQIISLTLEVESLCLLQVILGFRPFYRVSSDQTVRSPFGEETDASEDPVRFTIDGFSENWIVFAANFILLTDRCPVVFPIQMSDIEEIRKEQKALWGMAPAPTEDEDEAAFFSHVAVKLGLAKVLGGG